LKNLDLTDRKRRTFKVIVGALSARGRALHSARSQLRQRLGCEGIVSKRIGSAYRSGRSKYWVKVKNPAAPAVRREAEEDWGC